MRKITSTTLPNGVDIRMEALSTRLISVHPVAAKYEVSDEKGKLVGLDYGGDYAISKGDVITVGKQKYKISEVKKSSRTTTGYELYTFRKITTTGTFLMPFLGNNRNYWRWSVEFTNAFIGDEVKHDGTELYLLYRFSGAKSFADFEMTIEGRRDFIGSTEPDKYHSMYKFKIPEKYAEDVALIMEGKYSQISNQAKVRIMEFHNSNRTKAIGQILYKSVERKAKIESDLGAKLADDAELLDTYVLDQEIYKNKFKIESEDGCSTGNSDFV